MIETLMFWYNNNNNDKLIDDLCDLLDSIGKFCIGDGNNHIC